MQLGIFFSFPSLIWCPCLFEEFHYAKSISNVRTGNWDSHSKILWAKWPFCRAEPRSSWTIIHLLSDPLLPTYSLLAPVIFCSPNLPFPPHLCDSAQVPSLLPYSASPRLLFSTRGPSIHLPRFSLHGTFSVRPLLALLCAPRTLYS